MFIWTIGDAIAVACALFAAILFGIIWLQDAITKRRRARHKR